MGRCNKEILLENTMKIKKKKYRKLWVLTIVNKHGKNFIVQKCAMNTKQYNTNMNIIIVALTL